MRILICGIGAIGSNLTARLVSDLKGCEITVLDKDTVEERNISAGTQYYTREVLGEPKVEALQYLIDKNYEKQINIINQELTEKNTDVFLAQFTDALIIDCLDNYEGRKNIQQRAYHRHLNCLHIGFSQDFTFAIEWSPKYTAPSDITSGFDICEMPGASAFVNKVASIGALVAEEFVSTGRKIEIIGNKFTHSIIV